jgi:hypothetical protein
MADDNKNLLRSQQVAPLPIGPGGKDDTKNQLNNTNTNLTMMSAQSNANTKYDPDPSTTQPITKPNVSEPFCSSDSMINVIASIGLLCVVYGLIAK